ncbi:hypothetical protein BX589_101134 [Paraburkholderia fungorum]|jgi:hypothetical protein|nr:hypothetical protein BX589_101134 [Paraburkholderia fungorum]
MNAARAAPRNPPLRTAGFLSRWFCKPAAQQSQLKRLFLPAHLLRWAGANRIYLIFWAGQHYICPVWPVDDRRRHALVGRSLPCPARSAARPVFLRIRTRSAKSPALHGLTARRGRWFRALAAPRGGLRPSDAGRRVRGFRCVPARSPTCARARATPPWHTIRGRRPPRPGVADLTSIPLTINGLSCFSDGKTSVSRYEKLRTRAAVCHVCHQIEGV